MGCFGRCSRDKPGTSPIILLDFEDAAFTYSSLNTALPFWHSWIPPSDLEGCTGTPLSLSISAASQWLHLWGCSCISVLLWANTEFINKITQQGCIRLFCCDPAQNVGRRRRQQTPLPQKRADHQAESLFLTLLVEEQSLPKIFWNKWNNNIAIMVALSAMTTAWIDL